MAKYKQSEIDAMGKKGQAFGPDADGHYSYPVGDVDDLKNAIHAVGRGAADHDSIRKYIIGRAKALGQSALIPDNWNSDGSIKVSHEGDMELRTAVRSALRNIPERRLCPVEFELRAVENGTGGNDLLFTGYASVTGDDASYEMEDFLGPWTESVSQGAFRKTLSEGCDTAFLLNHQGMTLARTKSGTLKLSEHVLGSPTGLHVEAKLDPSNPTVAAMRSAIHRGDLDEMSFAFRVTRQEWSEDYDRRWIQEVNLNQGDVSLVNYGANPHTGGFVNMRSRHDVDWPRMFEVYAVACNEQRAGAKFSSDTVAQLQQMQSHLGDSDTVACSQILQSLIDSDQSGAAGNTEAESAGPSLEWAAHLELSRNREAEKKRRKAAA